MARVTSSDASLERLSRFDVSLWQRFMAIAQPYWYDCESGSGRRFFALLFLALVFVFALLFLCVSAIVLLAQHLFPEFMTETAEGLVQGIQGILRSPVIFLVMAGLVIPGVGFILARQQILPRRQQWLFLGLLLFLALSVSGLNVIISYVGNFFSTALADKDPPTFWRFLFVYAGVFVVGTPIVVFYGYIRDLLGLYWRDWMTQSVLEQYFQNRAYYEIDSEDRIDNPDQRISEDIRSFTTYSLRYLLILLNAVIDVISFTGILWSISKFLSGFLLGYALIGTLIVAFLGKRLVKLNFLQLRREADFRYGLVHVRDNAESIAFYAGEPRELNQMSQRFAAVVRNFNFLIGWQRNISFFTRSYDYAIIILPSLIMAPLYFSGQIEFGDITQANFAFNRILEAFSIFILNNEIENLSAFAAGINRLETFTEALDGKLSASLGTYRTFDRSEGDRIVLEHLTLQTPKAQRTLIQDLTASIEPGQGLVIVGQSGVGKSSLLRAIAGLWNTGTGKIVRPDLNEIFFLPQRPYMVLGSLRDQLLYPHLDHDATEAELHRVLHQVNLEDLPERVGGFAAEMDWSDILSLGEQQRLAFARLLLTQPRFAILDESTSALDLENERYLYQQLKASQMTFVSVGHRPSLIQYHDYVLKLDSQTEWQWLKRQDYAPDRHGFA